MLANYFNITCKFFQDILSEVDMHINHMHVVFRTYSVNTH